MIGLWYWLCDDGLYGNNRGRGEDGAGMTTGAVTTINSIEITKLELGGRPGILRNIVRIPSLSVSEVHYRFNTRIIGDCEGIIDLKVDQVSQVSLPRSRYPYA